MTPTKLESITSILERIPPQNLEAEQSLLGSILIDKDAIVKVIDLLQSEDFYKDGHRIMFEAMLDLFNKREPIDILSLVNILEEKKQLEMIGGRSALVALTNVVPTASHVRTYAGIIQKKATLRRLIRASTEIGRVAYNEDQEVDEMLDKAEQELFSVSRKYLKRSFTPITEALEAAFERIDDLHRNTGQLRGLPTGFIHLDNILSGLQKSDLIIVAARPSVGKTSLALDFARNIATKNKSAVGIFSLEMSKDQLIDRLLCSEARVDLWRMRTGRLSDREGSDDFAKIGHAIGTLSDSPIYIDDSSSSNIMEIRAKARRLQSEHGLDCLIVDYLQLMEGRGDADGRVQEVAEITRGLKGLARELSIPVVALSQLSRAVESRSPAIPKLSDLRESGCLAGDTLIMRADTGALIPIQQLVGQKNIPVYSLNEETMQLEVRRISTVFSSGKKKLFKMTLRSGRTVKASANHPFYTVNGWRRLDQVVRGLKLALPRTLQPLSERGECCDEELILLAHLIGDGCVLPRQPIHYTNDDRDNIAMVANAAQKLFGITPRIVPQKNWFHVYLPSPYHLTHGKRHPITNWFTKLGIEPVHSYKKVLPSALFTASEMQTRLFLHHLWATDGNVSWKKLTGRKPAAAIYYATTSAILASQVQHLLLRLGIPSTLRQVPQKKGVRIYRTNHQVHIQGAEAQLRFCEHVGCYGSRGKIIPELITALKDIETNPNTDALPREVWETHINPARIAAGLSWRDLSEKINTAYCGSTLFKHGVSRERMMRVATAVEDPSLFTLAQSDITWDEILSITPLGIEEVFDATVPGTHNFVANDFIVHNSIEQDADVVMFIYRKAADRSVSDVPPEQKHLAEIHIAKHRNGPTGMVQMYFDEGSVSFRTLENQKKDPLG